MVSRAKSKWYKPKKVKKLALNSNFDKRCSGAHFVSFVFYYYFTLRSIYDQNISQNLSSDNNISIYTISYHRTLHSYEQYLVSEIILTLTWNARMHLLREILQNLEKCADLKIVLEDKTDSKSNFYGGTYRCQN